MTGDDLAQQAWSDEQGTRAALELFQQHFDGRPGGVWAAPGRVNLIGDHVDYNDGTCLPGMLSLWLTRFLIPPGRRGVS